jgi:hypothetical protein
VLDSGGVDQFWNAMTATSQEVMDGFKTGRYFNENRVIAFLDELERTPPKPRRLRAIGHFFHKSKNMPRCPELQKAVGYFIGNTRMLVDSFVSEQAAALDNLTEQQRLEHPLHYNLEFTLTGAQTHLQNMTDVTASSDAQKLCAQLPALRDSFSLFPRNTHIKEFLGDLLKIAHSADAERLRKDCDGKRVILHTSCQHRLEAMEESLASFEPLSSEVYHHIVLVGAPERRSENETGLSFAYDGHILHVPVPDFYEHLHRKLFYAYMLFDLLTVPQLLIKVDDDLVLDDATKFVDCMDFVVNEKAAYAGRVVGAPKHEKQLHGWHIGKCADPVIEKRGYQYPLAKSYASGGYGYVLSPEGLSACSYMYLSMKEFFDQRVVGLEDVCAGHAAYAVGIETVQLADTDNLLCLPGLTTKARRRLDAQ